MRVKNISGGQLDVRVPGFERVVEDGEIVEIPDFQPDGESPIVVPPDKWEPVADKKAKADTTTAKAAE